MGYFIEICGADSLGAIHTFYVTSESSFMSSPSDSPANIAFLPCISTAGNFERHAWKRATTRGGSSRGFGAVELVNSGGDFDYFLGYGFDGQSITIRSGDSGAGYPFGLTTLFSGVIVRAEITWELVKFTITDRQGDISDRSYQTSKFAGNNSLPSGVEGVSTDLMGKPKPKLKGYSANFAPPCVNTSGLVYQLDDGTALLPCSNLAVYDRGAPLTAGTHQTSFSTFMSTTPTVATYDWYAGSEGWFIKLGSSPSGVITCTASEGTSLDRTSAQIVRRIWRDIGGVQDSDILGVDALDAKNSSEVGIWVGDETTIGTVVAAILDSVNGALVDLRDGRFKFCFLVDPATQTIVAEFESWHIKDFSGLKLTYASDPGTGLRLSDGVNGELRGKYNSDQDTTAGIPVWRVLLDWGRNFTIQTATDLAGIVASNTARVAYLEKEYRTVDVSDSSVLLKHKKAPEFSITTQFKDASAALSEAVNQLALRKVTRVVVEFPVDPDFAKTLQLLDTVTISLSRFNWSVPRPFVIIGMVEDLGSLTRPAITTLILWGSP